MANKNSDEIPNLDELLELTGDDFSTVELPSQEPEVAVVVPVAGRVIVADPAETAEQAEIRELRAALALAKAEPVETPEQAEIRELKAELARRAAPVTVLKTKPAEDSIIIHFVADGFLAFGQSWYRGQELEIVIGSPQHKLTFDIYGNTWLDLDADAQYERWGMEKFRPGLWRGKKWGDTSSLTDPEEIADAERAAAVEAKRRRAAPNVSTIH